MFNVLEKSLLSILRPTELVRYVNCWLCFKATSSVSPPQVLSTGIVENHQGPFSLKNNESLVISDVPM